MDLEGELWQKAAEWSKRNHGWCEKLREAPKTEWGVILLNCNEGNCDKYDECKTYWCAESFVAGCNWMMHRVKPIVYDKVIKDLVTNESPYQDGPAYFEEKIEKEVK